MFNTYSVTELGRNDNFVKYKVEVKKRNLFFGMDKVEHVYRNLKDPIACYGRMPGDETYEIYIFYKEDGSRIKDQNFTYEVSRAITKNIDKENEKKNQELMAAKIADFKL